MYVKQYTAGLLVVVGERGRVDLTGVRSSVSEVYLAAVARPAAAPDRRV